MADELRVVLRGIGELAPLSDESLDVLIAAAKPLSFSSGELLMAQGDPSEFADVLLKGEVEIAADSARGAIPLAGMTAPALVGDLGALAGLPRTASVRARGSVEVLRVPKAALAEAALGAPRMLIDALARLGGRLRRVNSAIGLYTHALAALERGEFPEDLHRELRDPAPDLVEFGETFARIAKEIVLRRQRNDEMASAAIIQRALLPDPLLFAQETGLDVHAAMIPTREVGGDFFELLTLSDGRVVVGVGDVCGKGVPAALYMGISKTLIRMKLRERPDLAAAIHDANAYLTVNYPAEQFATLFYAAFDPATGALDYVSCGHPAARIRRADGRIEALGAGGLPLGLFDDLAVKLRTAVLDKGDVLFAFSDGVTEAADSTACDFGEARLGAALAGKEGGAAAVVDAVVAAARAFAGMAAQSDDITALALRA